MKHDHIVVHSPSLPATQLFLLFHDAGDHPADMGAVGGEFARVFPRAQVVSIGAPRPEGEAAGRQWYSHADVADEAARVAAVLPDVVATVRHWQQLTGIRPEATALVGFARGSTVILEAVAAFPGLAGRVVAFSGRYATLPQQASTRTTIHLIHGDNDEVIPLTHAVEAQERLTQLGGDVTLDIVDDLPHAIDEQAMRLASERLQFTVPRRYFDEALGGGKPGEDDVIALM